MRSDRIGAPVGLHERRVLAWLGSRGSDALAGRVVWCAAALSGGHAAGRRLRELLDDDLETAPLAVAAAEPALVGRVRPGDVVVLHDCFTASFAAGLRDCGAHVIWHLRSRSGSPAPRVRAAIGFLDRGGGGAADAVLIDEHEGSGGELIAAFLPAAQLLDIREVSRGGDAARAERVALAWISLLGDVVEEDRADRVGGTIQARPVVAAR